MLYPMRSAFSFSAIFYANMVPATGVQSLVDWPRRLFCTSAVSRSENQKRFKTVVNTQNVDYIRQPKGAVLRWAFPPQLPEDWRFGHGRHGAAANSAG